MKIFALIGLVSIVSSAHANGGYFARFETLRRTFPEAFALYADPYGWLPPMAKGRVKRSMGGFRDDMLIEARLTPMGLRNAMRSGNAVAILSEFQFTETGRELLIEETKIATEIPTGYAWRILIAELLLEFPQTERIWISTHSSVGTVAMSACAEALATGEPMNRALNEHATVKAATDFGFKLTEATIAREGESRQDVDHYYPNDLNLELKFERSKSSAPSRRSDPH